ncbi:hypothetical protein [Catenulispora yoronensis]|uniref:hypothetical protein n=1 Tax=Catenulispora yoronensis TaxID=450799 RepID=UPI0031D715A2
MKQNRLLIAVAAILLVAATACTSCTSSSSSPAAVPLVAGVPSSLPAASAAEVAEAPRLTVAHAYDLPPGWHVDDFGAWLGGDYVAFEAVKPATGPGPQDKDARELWILRQADGSLRRIPPIDPASVIANDDITGGWVTRLEKTPKADGQCRRRTQAGCYSWNLYAIRASDGARKLLAQAPHPMDQVWIPLPAAHDGTVAWQQSADDGKSFDIMQWKVDTPAPVKLTTLNAQSTVTTDNGHVYVEQSALEADGSRHDSVINLVEPGGVLRPVASYSGPCCADVKNGLIAYMTGAQDGDGAASITNSDLPTEAHLTGAAPIFKIFGIYTAQIVDTHHLLVTSIRGDFVIDTRHPETPATITAKTHAGNNINASDGLIADPVSRKGGVDTLYILSTK